MGIKYVEYRAKWEHGLLPGGHFKPHEETQEAVHAPNPPPAAAGQSAAADAAQAPATGPSASQGAAKAPTPPVAGIELPGKNGPLLVEKSRIAPSAEGPGGTVRVLEPEAAAAERVHLGKRPSNVQIFFSIYFLMTGLHGIHVLVGIGLISWILVRSIRGDFSPEYFTPVDFVGLYWHLVDVIWIFLFPLLYLIA